MPAWTLPLLETLAPDFEVAEGVSTFLYHYHARPPASDLLNHARPPANDLQLGPSRLEPSRASLANSTWALPPAAAPQLGGYRLAHGYTLAASCLLTSWPAAGCRTPYYRLVPSPSPRDGPFSTTPRVASSQHIDGPFSTSILYIIPIRLHMPFHLASFILFISFFVASLFLICSRCTSSFLRLYFIVT